MKLPPPRSSLFFLPRTVRRGVSQVLGDRVEDAHAIEGSQPVQLRRRLGVVYNTSYIYLQVYMHFGIHASASSLDPYIPNSRNQTTALRCPSAAESARARTSRSGLSIPLSVARK